jgi:hypothetical protein
MTHVFRRVRDAVVRNRVWRSIVQRCTNPRNAKWSAYGGRGITLCARWRESFAAFAEDVGSRPGPRHSLDRIDNSRGYEPGNLRWALPKTQMRNMRTNVRWIFQGETLCIAEWAERTGIGPKTLWSRVAVLRWPIERALTEPVQSAFGRRSA